MRSPPKRLTRARAKDPEPATSKQTKIITASAKAKANASVSSTLTANTKSTAAKRKARSDDADEEERQATQIKRPRGRPPKKPISEQTQGARKPILKTGSAEASKEVPPAPKPGRGRPRKVESKPEDGQSKPEPVKKARGRPPTVMKPASSTATTGTNKPPVKKVVKFREPDKENVEPAAVPREPVTTTGMRGRPARRGGAAAARNTRPAAKTSKPQAGDKKPLSPKKITQLMLLPDDSEDELALEKVSTKSLAKSPIKPPSKKSDPLPAEFENVDTTVAVNAVMFDLPEINSTILASPARRHTSPPRDTIKSPAKRMAMSLPGSTLKLSNDSSSQTPFKPSTLLQSAAKRPQSPTKPFIFSAQKEQPGQSAAKPSMLQSPAKRAMPGLRSRVDAQPELPTLDESPLKTPSRPPKSSRFVVEEELYEDDDASSPFTGPIEIPQFSLRQSPELPSELDFALTEEGAEVEAEVEAELVAELEAELDAETGEATEEEVEVEEEPEAEAEDNDEEEPQPATETAETAETLSADEEEDDAVEDSIIVATGEDQAEDEEAPAEDDDAESEDTMVLDDLEEEVEEPVEPSPKAEPQTANHFYQLRQKDLDPCNDLSSASESEDDTLPFERITAAPSVSGERTPRTRASRSSLRQSRRSNLGFTPLSNQLGSWSAASPVKNAHSSAEELQPEHDEDESLEREIESSNQDSPMKNSFPSGEMASMQPEVATLPEMETAVESIEQISEEITEEDMALAQETNEMSLTDSKEGDDVSNSRHSFDDSLSDASQEYRDENQVPVESPTLSSQPQAAPPVTPVSRPRTRSFNTTTKIPLKPADNSTPSPLKKKSFSASRAAPKRPSQPKRGAPVLSYAEKPRRRSSRNFSTIAEEPEQSANVEEPSTPTAKMDMWASIGTPGRTPRKDLNPNLLRGAIVFVDVHTIEGADASGIFVELLTQMGARCPQKWNWNPSNSSNGESTRVGITHVVFKDGSKRTLEKVREAKGVVQCVGVSWVLDCERDNQWLDESPYNIDTSSVPRGGARRRKSMEPKSISNQNGSAVDGSSKGRRESAPAASPKTPNRRQSSIWIHTPSDGDEEEQKEEEDIEWSNLILTPVPKTPAPETIMNYAMETPSNLDDEEDNDDENAASLRREELLTRTCPPRAQKFVELGGGILSKTQDDHVLQRLMAARRKSLQFAPKVGSPLAKMWQ
ncbi:hypothetical protein M431DRAFT_84057 [Trichoderma harzianum CBS 226.95]|uniref:BRCT domain-containing protein n=1 Tax=Trichoderma harzianum CBS 226.95 TaxID=983964 RepID=A0A2T4AEE6_TRIHA|nr:hypothetical protein M431DRAFT_84057 [Trichoderma harzianum CBS 226.95]PTB55464.1 hypothetical protein M431DRAFT_84057 [Trichoderma harzianum CBS 226.95]